MDKDESDDLITFYNEELDIEGTVYPRYIWVDIVYMIVSQVTRALRVLANPDTPEIFKREETIGRDIAKLVSEIDRAETHALANVFRTEELLQLLPPLKLAGESLRDLQAAVTAMVLEDRPDQEIDQVLTRGLSEAYRLAYDQLKMAGSRVYALAHISEIGGWPNSPAEKVDIPDPIPNERLAELAGYIGDNKGHTVSRLMRAALEKACTTDGSAKLGRWYRKSGEHGLEWTHEDLRRAFQFLHNLCPLKKCLKANGFGPAKQPTDATLQPLGLQ